LGYRAKAKYDREGNVDPHTSQKAGDLLFDQGVRDKDPSKSESKYLDQKTRVIGKDTMSALMFYNILWEIYACENARILGDGLKRLLIGYKGEARAEAVQVLAGNLPKSIEIETGNID